MAAPRDERGYVWSTRVIPRPQRIGTTSPEGSLVRGKSRDDRGDTITLPRRGGMLAAFLKLPCRALRLCDADSVLDQRRHLGKPNLRLGTPELDDLRRQLRCEERAGC